MDRPKSDQHPQDRKAETWEHPVFLVLVGAVAIALIAYFLYRYGWHSGY